MFATAEGPIFSPGAWPTPPSRERKGCGSEILTWRSDADVATNSGNAWVPKARHPFPPVVPLRQKSEKEKTVNLQKQVCSFWIFFLVSLFNQKPDSMCHSAATPWMYSGECIQSKARHSGWMALIHDSINSIVDGCWRLIQQSEYVGSQIAHPKCGILQVGPLEMAILRPIPPWHIAGWISPWKKFAVSNHKRTTCAVGNRGQMPGNWNQTHSQFGFENSSVYHHSPSISLPKFRIWCIYRLVSPMSGEISKHLRTIRSKESSGWTLPVLGL